MLRTVILNSGIVYTDDDYDILLLDYGVQMSWETDEGYFTHTYPWHTIRKIEDVEDK